MCLVQQNNVQNTSRHRGYKMMARPKSTPEGNAKSDAHLLLDIPRYCCNVIPDLYKTLRITAM